LVGAVSGAGARLAMVGAYRLAGELAGAPDHRVAFQRYEQGQRELVAQAQRAARTCGCWCRRPDSAAGCANGITRLPLAGMEGILRSDRVAPLPDHGPICQGA
jgi:2-polyprenyl-6-methoxyphenol hydroxylase-like FAD-dependent oxidoreductase